MELNMQLLADPADSGQVNIPEQVNVQRLPVIQDLQIVRNRRCVRIVLFFQLRRPDAFRFFTVLFHQREQVDDLFLFDPDVLNTHFNHTVFGFHRLLQFLADKKDIPVFLPVMPDV